MDVSAVILAGGLGRRMGGRNKALLSIGGERFIDRQLRICSAWTNDVAVVTNDAAFAGQIRQQYNVKVVADQYIGEGPLAGLHAGISAVSGPFVWVLACDQPMPDSDAAVLLYERLQQQTDMAAALPVIHDRPQPLHALYRKETAAEAEALLQQGERRLIRLLDRMAWIGVSGEEFERKGIPIGFADDVDTPEQYERVCRSHSSR